MKAMKSFIMTSNRLNFDFVEPATCKYDIGEIGYAQIHE